MIMSIVAVGGKLAMGDLYCSCRVIWFWVKAVAKEKLCSAC